MGKSSKGSVKPKDIPSNGPNAVKRVLYIDAYDSFSRNIIDLLESTLKVVVKRISIEEQLPDDLQILANKFDAVVAGPGPGTPTAPKDVGLMKHVWELRNIPVLGICLGFQSLCFEHGATVERLPEPRHGRVVKFLHSSNDIFRDLPLFEVTLYHSLQVKLGHYVERFRGQVADHPSLWSPSRKCQDLQPLAWYQEHGSTYAATLMGVRHRLKPFWGVQFHPESCKSDETCKSLIKNWWDDAQEYNAKHRRFINRQKLDNSIFNRRLETVNSPELEKLIKWASSGSRQVCYRVCSRGELTTERISEIVGVQYNPSVVLEVDSRYSIISVHGPGSWTLETSLGDDTVRVRPYQGKVKRMVVRDAMEEVHRTIRRILNNNKAEGGDPEIPFWGGFLGYFSYEAGVQPFDVPASTHIDGERASDVSLLWVDRSIVIDKVTGKIYVQSLRKSDHTSNGWLDLMVQRLLGLTHTASERNFLLNLAVMSVDAEISKDYVLRTRYSEEDLLDAAMGESCFTHVEEEVYKKKIEDCQEYIRRGDSYELCLTGETKISLPNCTDHRVRNLRSWLLYKRLQRYNPASYSGYARIGNAKVISSSPELFMRWDRQSTFEMKPMKGTVKKSPNMTVEKATQILSTPKEMGENLMIADLIRHDMSKLCGSGRVNVVQAMAVEEHSLVYQLVTHIKGSSNMLPPILQEHGIEQPKKESGNDHHALLECLPPGSMTGAPKKRSCEILDRVENRKRGIYSGVMGFLDVGGGGSFSVLIRSAFSLTDSEDGEETWRIGAGGAITALSTAQGEWDEMVTKLNTVLAIFRTSESDESQDGNQQKRILKDLSSMNLSESPELSATGSQASSEMDLDSDSASWHEAIAPKGFSSLGDGRTGNSAFGDDNGLSQNLRSPKKADKSNDLLVIGSPNGKVPLERLMDFPGRPLDGDHGMMEDPGSDLDHNGREPEPYFDTRPSCVIG